MRKTLGSLGTVVTLLLSAVPAFAQDARSQAAARAELERGVKLYDVFNIEAARPVLQSVVRRERELTRAEAASAYKHLAGAYAILGLRDSAVVLFREALKRDSTMSLDPAKFARVEIDAFEAARAGLRAP